MKIVLWSGISFTAAFAMAALAGAFRLRRKSKGVVTVWMREGCTMP